MSLDCEVWQFSASSESSSSPSTVHFSPWTATLIPFPYSSCSKEQNAQVVTLCVCWNNLLFANTVYFIFFSVMEVAKCILLPGYFALFFEGICFRLLLVSISDVDHLQCSSPICCTSALPNKTGSSTVVVSSSPGLHIGVYTGFSGTSR